MDFSDVDNDGRNVGSEVSEVENVDNDFGDGDGVNDFDEAYNEMNFGSESLEYFGESENKVSSDFDVNNSNETTDEKVNAVLSDFDDDSDGLEENSFFGDDSEKTAVFENVSYHQGENDVGALGTCGPTSIANSLNRVTGTSEYSENAVLHNAMDNNLCHKSDNPYSYGGTTTKDVVTIIDNVKDQESNIHTEVYEYDKALGVDELADRLDDHSTVAMVGVDSATLWDQRGDVTNTGLFQSYDAPSDHWITVDSPVRDDSGNVKGFNIIDSGGGVDYVDRDKFESMYKGDSGHTISDPTAIVISNNDDPTNILDPV